MTQNGIKERRGDSPRGATYIWLQQSSRGLRVGFNYDSLKALGFPERVDIRLDAGGVVIEPTDYYDVGLALVRPNPNWVEVVSTKLLRKYRETGINLPLGVWIPAEAFQEKIIIKAS